MRQRGWGHALRTSALAVLVRSADVIAAAYAERIAAVEMEAAAFYALASAKGYPVVCYAHVTNTMATAGDDFGKGPDQGSQATLAIIGETARIWRGAGQPLTFPSLEGVCCCQQRR